MYHLLVMISVTVTVKITYKKDCKFTTVDTNKSRFDCTDVFIQ